MKPYILPLAATFLTGVALAASRASSASAPLLPDDKTPIKGGTAPSGTNGKVAAGEEVWLRVSKDTDVFPTASDIQHPISHLPAGFTVKLVSVSGSWAWIYAPAAPGQAAFEGWVTLGSLTLTPVAKSRALTPAELRLVTTGKK